MDFVLVVIFLVYIALVGILIVGWADTIYRKRFHKGAEPDAFITVLIPVRNESQNIDKILKDLVHQTYHNFEVIVIDDHSEDDSVEIAQRAQLKNLTIVVSKGAGKKQALLTGVRTAKGNLIVTTDADCRVKTKWLETINETFGNTEVKFAFGGVRIDDGNSFFGSLQQLEFSSLIGTGAATCRLGIPTMCNGANVAFRKEVFNEVNGYDENLHIPSGDDEFLMRKVCARYSNGVAFLSAEESVVSTQALATFSSFLHQRIRWAGKWRLHRDKRSSLLALFIFAVQLGTLLTFITVTTGSASFFLVIAWSFKITMEWVFLWRVNVFLSNRWNWLSFIFLQLVYPFYVIFIGLSANVRTFVWKGRKLKSIQSKPMYP